MKKIKLTKGKYAIVDNEDYPYLSRLRWHVKKTKETINGVFCYYAILRIHESLPGQTKISKKQINIRMEQFLIKIPNNYKIAHINRNTLDNRKSNLRPSTQSKSMAYAEKRKLHKGKKCYSKYKGVSCAKNKKGDKKWFAYVQKNKKKYYLGYFATEKDAALAYNKKAENLFGEYAYQNKI